ncbi:S41 family peptidase [Intestinibacillus massiliensis]|uniref:S41 family peptidase n=1 Tax=Intestinibacillus massiliensis TaxID=1871029 RepID=UPI000B34AFE2|nr:S41 family peptidase [Intestinibacillus massiliensis]
MHQLIAGLLAALLAATPIGTVGGGLPEPERITVTGELAKLPEKNWNGLTGAQMLEDFDYLYQALDENYPYFEVGKRMSGGAGLRDTYAAKREELKDCGSDMDFFLLLDDWLRTDGASAGHLGVLMPGTPEAFGEVYHELSPGSPYDEAYNSDKVKKSYGGFGKLFNPVWDRVMAYYGQDTTEEAGQVPNVETKILEPGKIAYVNIRSFDMMCYDDDEKTLKGFYKQVADYDHLIIDISENGGGGMSYFDNLIMEPNIDEPKTFYFYDLFKNGPMIQKFVGTDKMVREGWCEKADNFPQFETFNRKDLGDVDYFIKQEMTESPSAGQEKMFKGRIWLLVSGRVYSSSEWAAMVSKATGFATLVGTQTGGDGIGTDPIPVVLPNSGLIVRFSPIYGVTQEGLGSEEYGTTPDIVSPEGETPLETCLRAIREGK